ncbi:hypothetical protein E2F47_27480 [Mycobacterium eburneum]|nr:hypothetical protein [Mycobacterium eburneum]TDH46002.1 hypothetical protein E2F47_27480 [Mycobacterium eburneum]
MRHNLDQAAAIICADTDMDDPREWVRRQLKAGRFVGLKIGRHWYMDDQHIADNIARCENARTPEPEPQPEPEATTVIAGLSARAARRLRTA